VSAQATLAPRPAWTSVGKGQGGVKLRLLDAFSGAGGAGYGYSLAGFDVTGVDHRPMPRYPFRHIAIDALEYIREHGHEYDAIHCSPPCQAHSSLRWMHNAKCHVDLIPQTRQLLRETGLPYVIENVVGAPLLSPILLCGTMFGLGSGDAELRRHRLFETNWWPGLMPVCNHGQRSRVIGVYGGHGRDRRRGDQNTVLNPQGFPATSRREALGIDWMSEAELSQAIPPAFTRFVGEQLRQLIEWRAAGARPDGGAAEGRTA
jgi:DNA (cytosine-5)-methyltransferase 1